MICILKYASGQIDGWLIAVDAPDARRQAEAIGEHPLAQTLYRMEFGPSPGIYAMDSGDSYFRQIEKHEIQQVHWGFLMLVS